MRRRVGCVGVEGLKIRAPTTRLVYCGLRVRKVERGMVCWRRAGGIVIWIGWGEEDMVDGEARLSQVHRQVEVNEGAMGVLYYFSQRCLQAAAIAAVNCRVKPENDISMPRQR